MVSIGSVIEKDGCPQKGIYGMALNPKPETLNPKYGPIGNVGSVCRP